VFWSSGASGLPRRLLIVAAAALVPVLAGCEAGDNAPTLAWHYPTEGAGTLVHGIAIRNVFVLGAAGTGSLAAGHSAGLFLALVNTGSPDRLLSIDAPGTAASVTIPGGSISLGTNGVVLLTGPQPKAILTGLTRTLTTGSVVTVVLHFQKAGTVTLRVPVEARSQTYATYSPAPAPSPTTTKTKSPKAGASTTPTPTTTPTASSTP
jgi:copper(I)-binding protein